MEKITSEELKAFVKEQGGDLVGIAQADCFETTSRRRGPKFIMPTARSVVVFAQRLLVGSIESPSDMVVTFGSVALYKELDIIGYKVGRFLEQRGYRAAIVPSYSPVDMGLETKGFAGEVSLRHVAKAAGLGVLGKNNLLLTTEFGPRVRIGAVVTTAELQADEPSSKDFCNTCEACISACPVNALSEPGRTRVNKCTPKVLPYSLGRLTQYLVDNLNKSYEEIIETFKTPDFWNIYQSLQVGFQYGCHVCINVCPIGDSKAK